jgi:hypothetical protein
MAKRTYKIPVYVSDTVSDCLTVEVEVEEFPTEAQLTRAVDAALEKDCECWETVDISDRAEWRDENGCLIGDPSRGQHNLPAWRSRASMPSAPKPLMPNENMARFVAAANKD